VDDLEVIRRQIGIVLGTQRDLNIVAEAANAFEAIKKAERFQPDIVLLDISMPELNGLQAIPLIKKSALTARASKLSCAATFTPLTTWGESHANSGMTIWRLPSLSTMATWCVSITVFWPSRANTVSCPGLVMCGRRGKKENREIGRLPTAELLTTTGLH